jgi:hypothetical protein
MDENILVLVVASGMGLAALAIGLIINTAAEKKTTVWKLCGIGK